MISRQEVHYTRTALFAVPDGFVGIARIDQLLRIRDGSPPRVAGIFERPFDRQPEDAAARSRASVLHLLNTNGGIEAFVVVVSESRLGCLMRKDQRVKLQPSV